MTKRDKPGEIVARWMEIPGQLRRVVRGVPDTRLDVRAGPDGLSIRETVHHVVEANLVASNIIIAALANSGSVYDWTWVNPDASWMRAVGYNKAPIGPALSTLSGLSRHLAALLSVTTGGLERSVQLYDAPNAPRYTKTVSQILSDEVAHAREHIEALPPRRTRGNVTRVRRTSV